jgi:GTP-binding protein Era
MNASSHHAGHVAVIGRPNVGKSTLVNALVGAKLSIVSNRPQTTRHRLLGIATVPGGQLVLVDTPGLHREGGKRASTALNRVLNRAARGAMEGVDAAALVVEAGRWDDEDTLAYEALRESGLPVVLVVNQVDRIADKASLLPYLQRASEGRSFAACAAAGTAAAVRRGRTDRSQPALPRRRAGARTADAPARRGTAVRHDGRDRVLH